MSTIRRQPVTTPTVPAPRRGEAATPVSTTERKVGAFTMRALAVTRVALGFVYLWAFFDKLFGLSYSTAHGSAWIRGGSPTKGFLANLKAGPFRTTFADIAGSAWADWLFMIGLAGIGIALVFGVAMRIAATAGAVLMGLMWLAEFPPAMHGIGGALTGSTNPAIDYHIIYGLVGIVLAAAGVGVVWGLGKWWQSLPAVRGRKWLH